jgi:hypothetical protein|tara:strand:- start:771 stop:971 length:201 start_codon:yes stop_codon:yes gene_type:complete
MNNHLKKKGSRLEANHVKVRLSKNGQYTITVPRSIAIPAELKKGSVLHFSFVKGQDKELILIEILS